MHHEQDQPMFRPDSPVMHLGTASMLTVTSVRLWVAPHREPYKDHPYWQSGMQAAQLGPGGMHAFDTLFWIVLAAGKRDLDIRCLNCPNLGLDEAWMLQLVNHSQFGLYQQGMNILDTWMIRPAVRAAIIHLNLFAHAMSDAGLIVELPSGGARVVPFKSAAAGRGMVH